MNDSMFRARILETLAELPPATCTHIADAGDVDERTAAATLSGLVDGGVVAFDEGTGTYSLR